MPASEMDPFQVGSTGRLASSVLRQSLPQFSLILILCCLSMPAPAQHLLTPTTLTLEDGLSSRDIHAITQDGQGLMWFGTTSGLNRYDGYRILTFDDRDDHTFAQLEFLPEGLLPASDSTLWVVGNNQLYQMHIPDLSIHVIPGIEGQVWQVRKSRDGIIWIVSDNRSTQYLWRSADNVLFEKIDSVPRLRREFTDLKPDSAGNVWWSTNLEGLRQYNSNGVLKDQVKVDSFDWYGSRMYFTPLFIDSRNRMFLFPKSKQQVWQYFPEERRYEVVLDSLESLMYYAFEGSNSNIWFATKNTVYQLHPDGGWTVELQAPTSALDFTEIKALFEDRTNMLWIGTDGGLLRVPVRKQLFGHILARPGGGWGKSMRDIVEDQYGRIYGLVASGDPGLYMYDPGTGRDIKMQFQSKELIDVLNWANKMIYLPSQHSIWIYNNALLKITLGSNTIHQVKITPEDNSSGFNPISLLHDGRLIFGNTPSGLIICDPETELMSTFTVTGTEMDPDEISITCIHPGPDGNIWLGTMEDGLYLVNLKGEVFGHWNTKSEPAIGSDHVLCLFFENDPGAMWIGTFGGGLDHLDMHNRTVENFDEEDGLPDDKVVSILSDGNKLWMGTYNGLSCFDRTNRTFQNFFEEDGLSHYEFNYSSAFRDSQGRLYFGGMNGINVFHPEEVRQQEMNPPLQLTSFIEFNHREGRIIECDGWHHGEPVVISPYISYFQVEWTLPNYFHPDKNQYWTWLEGLEEDWSFLGNLPRIRFNSLPPGDYVLHIRGADSRGNLAANELAIPLTVLRIFYQRWWFIGLCAVLFGGIAFGILRYRYRQKLEVERVRTRIAGDLHDEVGSMLTGLAMQAELLEMQDASAGNPALTYIKDVSRSAVSKMRDMTWSIDSGRDKVEDLLDRMHEFANEVLTHADIVYTIQTSGMRTSQQLPVSVRRHLYLIYKEAVTNICKHSNATHVEIFLGYVDRGLEMRIKDNGNGFSVNGTYTGMGLENMRRRAEAIGGTCLVENKDGCLVKVKLGTGI